MGLPPDEEISIVVAKKTSFWRAFYSATLPNTYKIDPGDKKIVKKKARPNNTIVFLRCVLGW